MGSSSSALGVAIDGREEPDLSGDGSLELRREEAALRFVAGSGMATGPTFASYLEAFPPPLVRPLCGRSLRRGNWVVHSRSTTMCCTRISSGSVATFRAQVDTHDLRLSRDRRQIHAGRPRLCVAGIPMFVSFCRRWCIGPDGVEARKSRNAGGGCW
ncbi:hypothetical protein B0H14DRAFT_1022344 [Mycena olivaceomarginata]|nr:hypothetical protein B0H14DRAFT_1022344 [Mycena olivaceomarginata]